MCQYLYSRCHLLSQFQDVLISLLYLLIQVNVVDFELLKVDHVETFSQLLFLFDHALQLADLILKFYILQPNLRDSKSI